MPSASPSENSRNDNTISNNSRQDSYVNGLLQQIKLLELETSYLKQHPPSKDAIRHRKESGSERYYQFKKKIISYYYFIS